MRRLYYIYGGYWKANVVSPRGGPDSLYHSTNQQPITTSEAVDMQVDDYVFLRPTQSEHVMLQFGDLLAVKDASLMDRWPVFHQTGWTVKTRPAQKTGKKKRGRTALFPDLSRVSYRTSFPLQRRR